MSNKNNSDHENKKKAYKKQLQEMSENNNQSNASNRFNNKSELLLYVDQQLSELNNYSYLDKTSNSNLDKVRKVYKTGLENLKQRISLDQEFQSLVDTLIMLEEITAEDIAKLV